MRKNPGWLPIIVHWSAAYVPFFGNMGGSFFEDTLVGMVLQKDQQTVAMFAGGPIPTLRHTYISLAKA